MSLSDKVLNVRACRICLCPDLTDVVRFDQNVNLLNVFEYCVGLKITRNDEPNLICNNCAKKLQDYAKFKEKCIKSDSLWRSFTDLHVRCYAENTLHHLNLNIKDEIINLDLNNMKDQPNLNKNTKVALVDLQNETHLDSNDLKDDNEHYIDADLIDDELDLDIKDEDIIKIENEGNAPDNSSVSTIQDEEFICLKCNKKFEKLTNLTEHTKYCCTPKTERHKLIKKKKIKTDHPYYCGICEFVSYDKKSLDPHLAKHYTDNDLNCKQCNYHASDLAAIMRHRYSHFPSDIRTRKVCHLCDKKTQSALSLEFHYRSVHLGKAGGLCSLCNKRFVVFKKWKNHKLAHKRGNFICDHCGKKYVFRYEIIAHLNLAHTNVKNYICDECGNGFKRLYSLKSHQSSVHYKLPPVKCSHCDKYFKTPQTLLEHQKSVAANIKPFQCDVCNKCYASAYYLKRHSIWHSKEKPHCCDVCGSSYKAKGQLKIHLRTHSGERPYQCKLCMEAFMTMKILKRHQRLHTGDTKPFKCKLCDRGYTTNGSLMKHSLAKHKNTDDVNAKNDISGN